MEKKKRELNPKIKAKVKDSIKNVKWKEVGAALSAVKVAGEIIGGIAKKVKKEG